MRLHVLATDRFRISSGDLPQTRVLTRNDLFTTTFTVFRTLDDTGCMTLSRHQERSLRGFKEKRTQIDNLDLGSVVIDFSSNGCQSCEFWAGGIYG